MGKLTGKIAVITGGNSGIGLATARLFKEEGATVVINARNESRLAEIRRELGDSFDIIVGDVSQVASLESFFRQVGQRHPTIDVLFLNAGIAQFAPIELMDEATFDRQFSTNVKGVFYGVQKALPYLSPGASIILNTSIVNQKGMPASSAYAATKAAVRSFARTLSAELITRGIRVNAISPGPITTPIYDKMGMEPDQVNDFTESMTQRIPLKRFGEPEEVAKAALFFATQDSSFVVGAELEVDGGLANL